MAKRDIGKITDEPVTFQIPTPAGGVKMETYIPWTLVKRGVRRQVITPLDAPQAFEKEALAERRERIVAQSSALVRALGLAHHWQRHLAGPEAIGLDGASQLLEAGVDFVLEGVGCQRQRDAALQLVEGLHGDSHVVNSQYE